MTCQSNRHKWGLRPRPPSYHLSTGVLTTGAAVPPANALSADAPRPAAGAAAAAAAAAAVVLPLLRTLESLLPRLMPEDRQQLLAAVDALAAAPSGGGGGGAAGPVRAACLRLQRDLLLRHLLEGGGGEPGGPGAGMAEWLRAAPKALWGLGDRAPRSSGVLLSMLHHAARLAPAGSPLQAALQEVQPQLAPLLAAALPARAAAAAPAVGAPGSGGRSGGRSGGGGGAKDDKKAGGNPQRKQQQEKEQQQPAGRAASVSGGGATSVPVLVGPLARLPQAVQAAGADLVSLLAPLDPALARAMALAVRLRVYPDAWAARLLDGGLSGAPGSMDAEVYLQLVATLLCPRPGATLVVHAPAEAPRKRRAGGAAAGGAEVGAAATAGAVAGEGGALRVDGGFARHAAIVDCVCRWLHRFAPTGEAAALLEDCLAEQWVAHLAHRCAALQAAPAPGGAGVAEAAEEGVRCMAYSISSIAAAAAGTWVPPRLAAAAKDAGGGGGGGAEGPAVGTAAAEACLPPRLLQVVPAALAEQVAAAAADAAAAAPSSDDSRTAAAAAAAAAQARQFVLQLLAAAPQAVLPFLELVVDWAVCPGGDQGQQHEGEAAPQRAQPQQQGEEGPPPDAARLAGGAEAVQAVLCARPLLTWWLEREPDARALSARLAAAAAARERAAGDARGAAAAGRLAAALAGVYAR
jgi:hypothetical protein